jgi:hypothetical protein
MKNTRIKKFSEFIGESKIDISDDLKSNFRSWEQDCDNEEDAEKLFNIIVDRHPDVAEDIIRQMVNHWVGYEPVQESSSQSDSQLKELFGKLEKELEKKKVSCKIKLVKLEPWTWNERYEFVIELGRDYPDRLADKAFDAAKNAGIEYSQIDVCANSSGGIIIMSARVRG